MRENAPRSSWSRSGTLLKTEDFKNQFLLMCSQNVAFIDYLRPQQIHLKVYMYVFIIAAALQGQKDQKLR
jgi:hypothetical protein